MVKTALLALATAATAALGACVDLAALQAEAERGTLRSTRSVQAVSLVAVQQIDGARLAAGSDVNGLPIPAVAGAPLQRLVRPAAVATRAGELYVADLGLASVLRLAAGTQRMQVLAGAPAHAGVRLRTGGDRSLYVLDPAQRRVLRYAPDGRLAQTLAAPGEILGRPGALAVDERRGVLIVVDLSFNQLVMMPLLGGAPYPLINDARHVLPGLLDVAVGADGYYALGGACHCVTLFDTSGAPLASFGGDVLVSPVALIVDQDERVYVVDRADNSIHIFAAGKPIGTVSGAKLGAAQIADLDVDQGTLVLADGLGGRIVLTHAVPVATAGSAP